VCGASVLCVALCQLATSPSLLITHALQRCGCVSLVTWTFSLHSLTHSLTRSLTNSFTHFTHSHSFTLIHSLHSLTHTHSLTYSLIHSFTHSLTHSLTLIHSLHSLTLIHSLIHSLRYLGAWGYFASGWNWFDIFAYSTVLLIIPMRLSNVADATETNLKVEQSIAAIALLLAWLKSECVM